MICHDAKHASLMMKLTTTNKSKLKFACVVALALTGATLAGCAKNHSQLWAQTSPTLKSDPTLDTTVMLGGR